jgi:ATP-dependent Clp protease ATP-binding subunit ClpB
MAQNFTDAVAEALQKALSDATRQKATEVTENHLLEAFLQNKEDYFSSLLSQMKTDPDKLSSEVKKALKSVPTFSGEPQTPGASRNLGALIAEAEAIASQWKDTYTSSDHFLLAYWKIGKEPFSSWKNQTGISLKNVEDQIKSIRGSRHMDSPNAESSLQTLEKYCKNLTDLAKLGKLDPVIGRDEEIRRTMQVLSRRTKNNPMLIGDPGVGKTAIAEGLAQRIIQGDIPDSLKGKQI